MNEKKKKIVCIIIVLCTMVFSCFLLVQENLYLKNKSVERNALNIEEINTEHNSMIEFCILGNEIIKIDKSRFDDFGTGRLENRWELSEIDKIMESIKGVWVIDQYIGFVNPSIYYPDLFDYNDNLDKSIKSSLYDLYDDKVRSAKKNIPAICISIREHNGQEIYDNYIHNEGYFSPVSIILSLDKENDYYPIFVDQNAISKDFDAEYPVMYIRFTLYNEDIYNPATLIITSDNKFYILIDGAFYSLKNER